MNKVRGTGVLTWPGSTAFNVKNSLTTFAAELVDGTCHFGYLGIVMVV
jgi:hypothetical protein